MTAKVMIAEGDYDSAIRELYPVAAIPLADAKAKLAGVLRSVSPDGFDNCEVIEDKRHSGKMYSESLIFHSTKNSGIIFARFRWIYLGGAWRLIEMNLAQSLATIGLP